MIKTINANLLSNQQVIEEIERHKWIESEKAGRDIGFDRAAEDWLNRYSEQWMQKNSEQPKLKKRMAKRIF